MGQMNCQSWFQSVIQESLQCLTICHVDCVCTEGFRLYIYARDIFREVLIVSTCYLGVFISTFVLLLSWCIRTSDISYSCIHITSKRNNVIKLFANHCVYRYHIKAWEVTIGMYFSEMTDSNQIRSHNLLLW